MLRVGGKLKSSAARHRKKTRANSTKRRKRRTHCGGRAVEIQAPVGRGRATVGSSAVHIVRIGIGRRGRRGGGGRGLGLRGLLGGDGVRGRSWRRHGRRRGRIRRRRHRRRPSAPHAAASDAPARPRARDVAPEVCHEAAIGEGEGGGQGRGEEIRVQTLQLFEARKGMLQVAVLLLLLLAVVGAAVVLLHRGRADRRGHLGCVLSEAAIKEKLAFFPEEFAKK